MKSALPFLVLAGLLALGPVGVEAATCSARCKNCNGPTCTANCSQFALCQDGECGGFFVGCCCMKPGSESFCFSTSCGGFLPPNPLADPAAKSLSDPVEHWALVLQQEDASGSSLEVPFASSSDFAARLVDSFSGRIDDPQGLPVAPAGFPNLQTAARQPIRRFVLVPNGEWVHLEPHHHREILDRVRGSVMRALAAKAAGAATLPGMFAIRIDSRGAEVLFSDHPELATALTGPIATAHAAANFGMASDPVDVYLIRTLPDADVSVLHARYERAP